MSWEEIGSFAATACLIIGIAIRYGSLRQLINDIKSQQEMQDEECRHCRKSVSDRIDMIYNLLVRQRK